MNATRHRRRRETSHAASIQGGPEPGPLGNRVRCEAADRIELEVGWMALVVDRDRCERGDLAFGAAARLDARALATKVRVVKPGSTAESIGTFLHGHGPAYLLTQQPGGRLARAHLALDRPSQQPGLGLADEVEGQEPGLQHSFVCPIRLPAVNEISWLQALHCKCLHALWRTTW